MQLARELAPLCRLRALCSGIRPFASDSTKAIIDNTLVVDTLSTAKKFESIGFNREQSEALTETITERIILDRIRLLDRLVGKTQLEKVVIEQENRIATFKAELLQKQDMHLATLHKDLERQQNYLDKMRAEVRHEIDKLTASQRLDLNLEKGRMRDDLLQLRDKSTELEIKMDRDINELKATVEKAKNDTIKSVITIMGTFTAIVFTISRVMSMT
eukprot:jgi/Chrzof1/9806/Cz04g16100.t1